MTYGMLFTVLRAHSHKYVRIRTQAALFWAQKHARHPHAAVDLHWLDLDLCIWEPVAISRTQHSVPLPSARMLFTAVTINQVRMCI